MMSLVLIIPFAVGLFFFITFFLIFKRIFSMRKQLGAERVREMLEQVKNPNGEFANLAREMKNIAHDQYANMDYKMPDDYYDSHSISKTTYCKHCSRTIDKDSRFCKYCGQRQ